MWIIFRDPETAFNHLDKFVVEVVADEEILNYQNALVKSRGGLRHEIYTNVLFLQPILTTNEGVAFFARKYAVWSPA